MPYADRDRYREYQREYIRTRYRVSPEFRALLAKRAKEQNARRAIENAESRAMRSAQSLYLLDRLLSLGYTRRAIAHACGVWPETVGKWLQTRKGPRSPETADKLVTFARKAGI